MIVPAAGSVRMRLEVFFLPRRAHTRLLHKCDIIEAFISFLWEICPFIILEAASVVL
jgi:hypothetical protein